MQREAIDKVVERKRVQAAGITTESLIRTWSDFKNGKLKNIREGTINYFK
jgi:hypothetical protein